MSGLFEALQASGKAGKGGSCSRGIGPQPLAKKATPKHVKRLNLRPDFRSIDLAGIKDGPILIL